MDILGTLAGGLVSAVGKIIDDLHTSDEEKAEARLKITTVVLAAAQEAEKSYQAELAAKAQVMVAELQQEDLYSKRARPSIIYAGLVFVGINYVLAPLLARLSAFLRSFGQLTAEQAAALAQASAPLADLPEGFWWAWAGVAGVYVLTRSADKAGGFQQLLGSALGESKR